jgi:lipoprotein NlpD
LTFRAAGALLLLSFVLDGCSSRGSAPVYNRSAAEPSTRVVAAQPSSSSARSRPPAYPRSYHLVQPGDTLYSIAWRQNLSYHQLAAWNGIRPPDYQIFPGQRLRLKPPARRHNAPTVRKPQPRVAPTVQPPATTRVKPATPPPRVRQQPVVVTSKPKQPDPTAKALKLAWDWPTKGRVVQTFSSGDDTRKGIWIDGRIGQAVSAAEAGKVVYAGNGLVGYGNLIIIKHDRTYLSAYGYNSKLLVREGDVVKKGDVVAHMGAPNIGGQPVLHFEIRRQGKPVNPLALLPRK